MPASRVAVLLLASASLAAPFAPAAGADVGAPVVPLHGGAIELAYVDEVDTCVILSCQWHVWLTFQADGGTHLGAATLTVYRSCDGGEDLELTFWSDGVEGTWDVSGASSMCEVESWDGFSGHALLYADLPAPERAAYTYAYCGPTQCQTWV